MQTRCIGRPEDAFEETDAIEHLRHRLVRADVSHMGLGRAKEDFGAGTLGMEEPHLATVQIMIAVQHDVLQPLQGAVIFREFQSRRRRHPVLVAMR